MTIMSAKLMLMAASLLMSKHLSMKEFIEVSERRCKWHAYPGTASFGDATTDDDGGEWDDTY